MLKSTVHDAALEMIQVYAGSTTEMVKESCWKARSGWKRFVRGFLPHNGNDPIQAAAKSVSGAKRSLHSKASVFTTVSVLYLRH